MQIRPCESEDHAGVDALLRAAFPEPGEAQLTVALRAADADTLELIAELDGVIAGVVMFSPATAKTGAGAEIPGLALGPVAVLPDYQNRGIGAALIEAGLDFIRTLGPTYCIVLGDPDYYSRFGFEPAPSLDLHWTGDPEDKTGNAFQVMALNGAPNLPRGTRIEYHPAFDIV
ncbi:GNAT family N-acetyltransferase [Maricaulis sp.]|uniref:GNAT family N-acetyltransferase n=1 Tax=Maricaulis sp. TaxID=1486257 RepID=UPI003A93B3AC